MRLVVAPDKFRGTLTAAEAAAALADGLRGLGHDVVELPLADGGEGTLEALGGPNKSSVVTGPLGDPVEAAWRLSGRSAVIEMAQASGIDLVGGAEGNDPVAASTYGTGELIALAAEAGAREMVVGVGGSATTDGGLGALRALYPPHRLRGVRMTVACDVTVGFVDAARVFAPQKGATPAQVELLTRRLERLVDVYAQEYGTDVAALEGAGAAGGLAGALACVGAAIEPGFDLVAERLDLDAHLGDADAVVTGEGFLDEESFSGKVVGGVADAAAAAGIPVVAVVGECFDGAEARIATVSLVEEFGRDAAFGEAASCLGRSAEAVAERLVAVGLSGGG